MYCLFIVWKIKYLYVVFKVVLFNKYKIIYLCWFYFKVCGINFYGICCIEKCGYCSDGNLCDYINGICVIGCSVGY